MCRDAWNWQQKNAKGDKTNKASTRKASNKDKK